MRWVSWDDESASFLYRPIINFTDMWMWAYWLNQRYYLSKGTKPIMELMSPCHDHPSATVLSTFVLVSTSRSTSNAKMFKRGTRWISWDSLLWDLTWGYHLQGSSFCVFNYGEIPHKALPTWDISDPPPPPPITIKEAHVAPSQVGGCGGIYLRCVEHFSKDSIRCSHKFN